MLRLCVQVVTQWRRDRCPQHAAGLSFQSVLSIVPALAVALAAVRATGAMGAESALVKFLSTEFIPLSREEISSKLLAWSANINFQSLGIVGLVAILLIAFVTFNALELTINSIWRVEKRRSLPKRLATFYLTASIGPLFFGLSLYQAAKIGLTEGWLGVLLSAILAFTGLFFINFILPATKVRISAAVAGALVNTVAVELAKYGFAYYVAGFGMDRYSGIYGPVATVPLFLIWIYWSWLMLLLGVEVSHTVQNLHVMESAERRLTFSLEDELEKRVNASTATQVVAAIAAAQSRGAEGLSRFRITEEFTLSDDAMRLITNRLEAHDLLRAPAENELWSLAREADKISLLEIFDAFRTGGELSDPKRLGASPAEAAIKDVMSQSRSRAAEVFIADIAAEIVSKEDQTDS
jgi:membrane protein